MWAVQFDWLGPRLWVRKVCWWTVTWDCNPKNPFFPSCFPSGCVTTATESKQGTVLTACQASLVKAIWALWQTSLGNLGILPKKAHISCSQILSVGISGIQGACHLPEKFVMKGYFGCIMWSLSHWTLPLWHTWLKGRMYKNDSYAQRKLLWNNPFICVALAVNKELTSQ